MNVNRVLIIHNENIPKIFSILMKYSFNNPLFHSTLEKKTPLS